MSAKAARLLLDKGSLPDEVPAGTPASKVPEGLTKEQLRDLAWEVIVLLIERAGDYKLDSPEATRVAEDFVRAAAKIGTRSFVLGAAMLTRFSYFGPSWGAEAVRRAIETTPGGDALKTALGSAKADIGKVDRLAGV